MVKRWVLIAAGTVSAGLGILGVFVPLLPTTPFLLLAAACYARSSKRCHAWLLGNRFFGKYVRGYVEGRGVPLRVKLPTVVLLWATLGLSMAFAVSTLALRLIFVVVGIAVTIHILTLPTPER